MTDDNDDPRDAYTVRERDGRFEVRAPSGRAVIVCGDEGSACQYASLMNEAFKAGFKAGYREGRGGRK